MKKNQNLIFLFLLLFLNFQSFASTQVKITKAPKWVKAISIDTKTISDENQQQGGYIYMLVDLQDNPKTEETFRHYAYKILNNEGIQSMSDIDVDFDPTYQKLTFHFIRIHRNGKTIDKLNDHEIKTFQRENEMDRYLYDGSLTAVVNLRDVRAGDIIEYSFTISGYNPILKGHFFRTYYFNHGIPVNRIYSRAIVPKDKRLYFKYFNKAKQPNFTSKDGFSIYTWDIKPSIPLFEDNNIPSWYEPFDKVKISDINSWKRIARLFVGNYTVSDKEKTMLRQLTDGMFMAEQKEELIVEVIRFVQDNVRYLGFESGLSAYKPHAPSKVFKQRFGDCKDKSLLLATILNNEGIESYPVLVNTNLSGHVSESIPSSNVFNHCIVQINYKGKTHYIDPTITSQGGNLDNYYFPDYGKGLVIKENSEGLVDLKINDFEKTVINEEISFLEIGGPAKMKVITKYYGSDADNQREYFANNSKESIQKNYLNFYSNAYVGMKSTSDIAYIDHRGKNEFIVEEHYTIDKFWDISDKDENILFCEPYPLSIDVYAGVTKSPGRTMPYHLDYPVDLEQTITILLPESWNVTEDNVEISSDAYTYKHTIKYVNDKIVLFHHYKTLKDHIEAKDFNSFVSDHDKILGNLSFRLTNNKNVSSGFTFSGWFAVFLSSIIAGGIFFAFRLYNNYDPVAPTLDTPKPLGGWLVIVAIGLVISPIRLIYSLLSTPDFFNSSIWESLISDGEFQNIPLVALMSGEMIYNVLFIIFNVLLIFLFFEKRTSLPRLISIYYGIAFFGIFVDTLLSNQINATEMSSADFSESYSDIFRNLIVAAILVPYFNVSKRVKSTFVERLNGRSREIGFEENSRIVE